MPLSSAGCQGLEGRWRLIEHLPLEPALCLLRSEIRAWATIGNVGTPKRTSRVLVRPYIVTLVSIETSATLVYVLGVCEARGPRVPYPKRDNF